jgi:hypothetical protein
MSTDYKMVCFDCKDEGPIYASASIAYGFKVWVENPELLEWLGHRQPVGKHEGHDLRIVHEDRELPWRTEDEQ